MLSADEKWKKDELEESAANLQQPGRERRNSSFFERLSDALAGLCGANPLNYLMTTELGITENFAGKSKLKNFAGKSKLDYVQM